MTTNDLSALHVALTSIHSSMTDFRPSLGQPPILDSSSEAEPDPDSESTLPGFKQLKESVRIDLEALEKFLRRPDSAQLPTLSVNAPYLVAVWNELLSAPQPVVSLLKSFGAQGAKVDVVADGGRRWIRVNTIKTSRILGEFREIDSYLTDSEDEENDPPTLAATQFDNSVLRMARALLAAAKSHSPTNPPAITLRLTRLEPDDTDDRIAQTISLIRDMGIDLQLGELSLAHPERVEEMPVELIPTAKINLDLSVLIAFVSDLTHSPLPSSVDEARARFLSPAAQVETQARALTNQIMQEMLQEMGRGGMFQELHDRLLVHSLPVELWTTAEARERFLRIVDKIGGPAEKRRAAVLFDASQDEAEERFWQGSRFPRAFITCLPIRVYSEEQAPSVPDRGPFFVAMEKTCLEILALEEANPVKAKNTKSPAQYSNNGFRRNPDHERAKPTRANAKLMVHTVRSMLCGASRGWTTLTANRSSVRALVREMRERAGEQGLGGKDKETAAIWVVDPRSLAESARERVASQV
ncbi:hypothetical protein MKEN_00246600 [Mycena kentingensis (nom. inval.)]|nr:hypothetical protein MKEN_00246600 [Mycena kentingensis (nom. inval.)]